MPREKRFTSISAVSHYAVILPVQTNGSHMGWVCGGGVFSPDIFLHFLFQNGEFLCMPAWTVDCFAEQIDKIN